VPAPTPTETPSAPVPAPTPTETPSTSASSTPTETPSAPVPVPAPSAFRSVHTPSVSGPVPASSHLFSSSSLLVPSSPLHSSCSCSTCVIPKEDVLVLVKVLAGLKEILNSSNAESVSINDRLIGSAFVVFIKRLLRIPEDMQGNVLFKGRIGVFYRCLQCLVSHRKSGNIPFVCDNLVADSRCFEYYNLSEWMVDPFDFDFLRDFQRFSVIVEVVTRDFDGLNVQQIAKGLCYFDHLLDCFILEVPAEKQTEKIVLQKANVDEDEIQPAEFFFFKVEAYTSRPKKTSLLLFMCKHQPLILVLFPCCGCSLLLVCGLLGCFMN
jgi:hypothetical protein